MFDFACKKFEIRDVIKCGLGLTKSDFKIMEYLIQNDDDSFTSEELSKKLKLNLSTIQRGVKKLHESNIVIRKQTNLELGGFQYSYQIKYKHELRKIIMKVVNNWVKRVETDLEKW